MSLYFIASKVREGLFLGIEDNSMNEMANVVLTSNKAYAFWRIIGSIPQN